MARYRRKKMFELKFKDDKRALKKLEKAQKKVDKYSKKIYSDMSKRDHKKLKKSLKGRAKALSKATGMEIHSLFD